eukprot:3548699-Rhodomonas_salina.1
MDDSLDLESLPFVLSSLGSAVTGISGGAARGAELSAKSIARRARPSERATQPGCLARIERRMQLPIPGPCKA